MARASPYHHKWHAGSKLYEGAHEKWESRCQDCLLKVFSNRSPPVSQQFENHDQVSFLPANFPQCILYQSVYSKVQCKAHPSRIRFPIASSSLLVWSKRLHRTCHWRPSIDQRPVEKHTLEVWGYWEIGRIYWGRYYLRALFCAWVAIGLVLDWPVRIRSPPRISKSRVIEKS